MTSNPIDILLIEDEDYDVRRIQNTLRPVANRIRIRDVVASGRAALELLRNPRNSYDVVIMDFQIAGGLMGEELIRKIKDVDPALQIIVVTKMTMNMTDFDFANSLLEAGAMWYCTKYPGDIDEYIYQPTDFVLSIFNAYEKRKLWKERQRSDKRLQRNVQSILEQKRIVGKSAAMERLRRQIEQVAATDANVMICGDSGTGKELVANNIHYLSRRRFENFVHINCGSLPSNLIESELFGFEKGSFTGANAQKPGLFEVAHRGTIFLDEITEVPLSAQSKLLRVLEEGEIDKIGRRGNVQVDVRIIAATNRSLELDVQEKRFREDLYYRLNVVSITVLPLAQRREDIPLLIDHFIRPFSAGMNREAPEVESDAMDVLVQHEWRGNARELQNVLRRLLFAGSDTITVEQVNTALGLAQNQHAEESGRRMYFWQRAEILPWREMERKLQAEYFRYVRENAQSDADAARLLGLAPPNYYRMCKRLGIK